MGCSASESWGAMHHQFCSPEVANSPEYGNFWARLGRGEFFTSQFARRDRQGREVWLEASYKPVDSGRTAASSKVVRIRLRCHGAGAAPPGRAAGNGLPPRGGQRTRDIARDGEAIVLQTVARCSPPSPRLSEQSSPGWVNALGEPDHALPSIVSYHQGNRRPDQPAGPQRAPSRRRAAGETGRSFAVVAD